MFSWSIHTTIDQTRFVLTVPFHYVVLLIVLFWAFILLIFTLKSGHGLRNFLIVAGILLAFGFLMYSSQLTLDQANGTATLREFHYYHWSTSTYPLKDIDQVYVSTGSTTSQLNLQFTTGSLKSIDFLDQNGGKHEAAYAANQWLGNGR